MNKLNNILLSTIEKKLAEKLACIYYDKTFPSVIYGVNDDGTYQIVREGHLYTVPNGLGSTIESEHRACGSPCPGGTKNLKRYVYQR